MHAQHEQSISPVNLCGVDASIDRELAGPADSELARAAAPDSLRARFGESEARNAVHVTDLAQDGPLEAAFFF